MTSDAIETHPVQCSQGHTSMTRLRTEVVMRAYEVYCHIYGAQPAMVDLAKGCRGGFTVGEITAFLYARSFPKEEWSARAHEAFKGMKP